MTIILFFYYSDNRYPTLDWQRSAAKNMIAQLLNAPTWFHVCQSHDHQSHDMRLP